MSCGDHHTSAVEQECVYSMLARKYFRVVIICSLPWCHCRFLFTASLLLLFSVYCQAIDVGTVSTNDLDFTTSFELDVLATGDLHVSGV